MEGRGRFGYAVTLDGFTRDFGSRPGPGEPRRDHRPPRLSPGGARARRQGARRRVRRGGQPDALREHRHPGRAWAARPASRSTPAETCAADTPEWERDFLIVEEHLPAGTTLIEGSVKTTATSYELADGVLTFYFAPSQPLGHRSSYDVLRLPARPVPRAAAATVKSAYEPGRFHLGRPASFAVRLPGEPNTDPYKPTPDELYARGKAHFDAGRFAEAGAALEPLFAGYTLRDDVAKDAARMLLLINIKRGRSPQDRPVLRGRQGKGARAGAQLRPVAGDRQGLSRHQRI